MDRRLFLTSMVVGGGSLALQRSAVGQDLPQWCSPPRQPSNPKQSEKPRLNSCARSHPIATTGSHSLSRKVSHQQLSASVQCLGDMAAPAAPAVSVPNTVTYRLTPMATPSPMPAPAEVRLTESTMVLRRQRARNTDKRCGPIFPLTSFLGQASAWATLPQPSGTPLTACCRSC